MADYCTQAEVEARLARTLTTEQSAVCATLIPAATAWVNGRPEVPAEALGAIADEWHPLDGPYLFLNRAPIASITTVKVRSPYVGASDTTLTANEDYSIVSPGIGLLLIPGYAGWETRITYVPDVEADPRLKVMAVELVAHWLTPTLLPQSQGLEHLNLGQGELNMKFAREPIPPIVQGILASFGASRVAVFA